jgi:diguanylate cyclase (GGDEF)-like protein
MGVLALVPAIRTRCEVARWTVIQTLLALGLVIPTTGGALVWLYGGDFSRSVSGPVTLRFGLALAAIEALVFAPIIALRSGKTLRELTLARDQLDGLAHFDSLTGLLNRRGFDKAAAGTLESRTARGRPAAALMCDLDSFKEINDRFGHEFGDAALRHVANILRESVGGDNTVLGRVGGEEFALLLTDIPKADALAFAENLRLNIAAHPVEWRGATATITLSVGFDATPFWQGEVSPLLARADGALYVAKRKGRNRLEVAQEFLVQAA